MADSTVRTYLPNSFKHMEHASEHKEPPKFSGSLELKAKYEDPPEPMMEIQAEPPKAIIQPMPVQKTGTIEVIFDPAPIDRDRTQVFIIQIDPITKKVIKYKTVGRRSVRA